MKLPELPEEEQKRKPKPKEDDGKKAEELPKRKPKFGVYRGSTNGRPEEAEKNPAPMGEGKLDSNPAVAGLAQAESQDGSDQPKVIPVQATPKADSQTKAGVRSSGQGVAPKAGKEVNPGRRLHEFEEAGKNASPARVPLFYRLRPNGELTRRAYWDVAAAISLLFNAVLVGVVVVLGLQLRNFKSTANGMGGIADGVFGGLYSNFVKMDQASIDKTIAVDAQIPLNFVLPVSQNTNVVLTSDVNIPNAHVIINTGVLNINAQAAITLRAGTSLPVALNMNIPVQSTIPVHLDVPVHIPLNQTQLHDPFTGLQTTILPLYCTFNKDAQYPAGTYICAAHDAATPVTP